MHDLSLNRRRLLQHAGLGLAGALAWGHGWQAWAAPKASRRMLVVFLRGAYDATNLLVQLDSDLYYRSRPTLAIARPGRDGRSALPLTDGWGLHPALADSLYPLWQARSLAFVPFSGLDSPSRSHFEMQDRIEAGAGGVGTLRTDNGFINRLAAEVAPQQVAAFTRTLPTAARGSLRVPNVDLARADNSRLAAADVQAIQRMYAGTPLEPTVRDAFEVQRTVERELMDGEMHMANRGAVSPQGFRAVAPRLAKLMSGPFRLGFVDVGNWDTHVNQGGAQGIMADRLAELGAGLAEFQEALGPAWSDTVVVVISEFGRTFAENGNRGTDHGSGSALWVMGGAVKGGRLAGQQALMQASTLHENRDWPVLNDYRAVLGGLMSEWFRMDRAAVGRVLAGAPPQDLGLL